MLIIGHRGAAGYYIENTLQSIEKAIDYRADFIEVDVQATSDGRLVLFHDKFLDRLTDLSGSLSDYSYEELRQANLLGGNRIPLLQDACRMIKGTTVSLIAEVVSLGEEKAVLRNLLTCLPLDRFAVASFFHAGIRDLKTKNPNVSTIALLEGIPVNLQSVLRSARSDYIGFGFDSISKDAIKTSQRLGKRVIVWTVDDPGEIRRAYRLGVDGIITNYPDRVHQAGLGIV